VIYPPSLTQLIEALRCLPGVGPKSAQRMAFYLLERDRLGAKRLADSIAQADARVGSCKRCRMFAESELCPICAATKRERGLLCVVESPADVVAVEQSGSYRGCYFVLMGHLSPLDGIGPEQLGLPELDALFQQGEVQEVKATTAAVQKSIDYNTEVTARAASSAAIARDAAQKAHETLVRLVEKNDSE